jgi:hypothetical protein
MNGNPNKRQAALHNEPYHHFEETISPTDLSPKINFYTESPEEDVAGRRRRQAGHVIYRQKKTTKTAGWYCCMPQWDAMQHYLSDSEIKFLSKKPPAAQPNR